MGRRDAQEARHTTIMRACSAGLTAENERASFFCPWGHFEPQTICEFHSRDPGPPRSRPEIIGEAYTTLPHRQIPGQKKSEWKWLAGARRIRNLFLRIPHTPAHQNFFLDEVGLGVDKKSRTERPGIYQSPAPSMKAAHLKNCFASRSARAASHRRAACALPLLLLESPVLGSWRFSIGPNQLGDRDVTNRREKVDVEGRPRPRPLAPAPRASIAARGARVSADARNPRRARGEPEA